MRTWLFGAGLALATCAAHYAVADAATGDLVVSADPAGGDVYIDGDEIGPAPVKRALTPGEHFVEVRWDGSKATQIVKVTQGRSAVVSLQRPAAPQPAPPSPPPPRVETAQPQPPPPQPPPPPETAPTEVTAPSSEKGLVDVTPSIAIARIDGDVLSPAHPVLRHRLGAGAGLGFRCTGAESSACNFVLHFVPLEYSIFEIDVDLIVGGVFGFNPGFALGSPWFRVGPASSPVYMTVRARTGWAGNYGTAVESYGAVEVGGQAEAAYALTRLVTLDAMAVGGPIWAYPMDYYASGPSAFGWFFQITGGVRL